MPNQKILNKDFKKEGEEIVINESLEKRFTKTDLLREKQNYQQNEHQIIKRMKELKEQYEQMRIAENEIDEMLNAFSEETLPEIPAK
ncbi:MAG: hypothetical protein FH761_16570 [Firmicutes bacterium]|nr:hypothetical protein [Bacillota bacterium]